MLLGAFAVSATIALVVLIGMLAIYALPLLAGGAAAWLAFDRGAGWLGAGIVGLIVAGVTLGVGEFAFARMHSYTARIAVATLFAGPAALAGYLAAHGIAIWALPNPTWQLVLSAMAGAAAGLASLANLAAAPHIDPAQRAAARLLPDPALDKSIPVFDRFGQSGSWRRPLARRRLAR